MFWRPLLLICPHTEGWWALDVLSEPIRDALLCCSLFPAAVTEGWVCRWWEVDLPSGFSTCLAGNAALWPVLTPCLPLPFVPQVQRAEIREGPAPDLHHLHLCERGAVGDPALGAQRRQPHARPPAQGDHPGGRQQRRG